MKKIGLILGFAMLSIGVSAQELTTVKRSDLQGPAYKNYKPWKHKNVSTVLYVDTSKKGLTGPAYKNFKPWESTSNKNAVVVNTSGHERQKLTGPAYKNYKPWTNRKKE